MCGVAVAIIKPHVLAAGNTEKVVEIIEHNGFYVNRRKELALSKDAATQLLSDRKDAPGFDTLVDSVSWCHLVYSAAVSLSFWCSGPVLVLVLSKLDAVRALTSLAGPSNVKVHLTGAGRLRGVLAGG